MATILLYALRLSHFSAVTIFAALASVVFGMTLRETRREQVRYGLFCFASFLAATIIVGWVMYMLNPR